MGWRKGVANALCRGHCARSRRTRACAHVRRHSKEPAIRGIHSAGHFNCLAGLQLALKPINLRLRSPPEDAAPQPGSALTFLVFGGSGRGRGQAALADFHVLRLVPLRLVPA